MDILRGVAVLGSPKGRYVFGKSSVGGEYYMLDTETGKVWRRHVIENGEQVLLPLFYSEPFPKPGALARLDVSPELIKNKE